MNKQIQKVTQYIKAHLDKSFNIEELASIACYSNFHFCRIFKVSTGESVMAYTTRLRLERASQRLTIKDSNMLEIALDSGFETPAGFNKAFRRCFGTSPTDYRNRKQIQLQFLKEIKMITPEIITRETAFIVFERQLGSYRKSSDIAWKNLSAALNKLNDIFKNMPPDDDLKYDIKAAELLGLCHDDPKVTDEENVRYDAAVAWTEDEIKLLAGHGYHTKEIAGGKYAKTLFKGSYGEAEKIWYGIYAWLIENKAEFRDEPAFEKYLNTPEQVSEDELLTEIYIPVV